MAGESEMRLSPHKYLILLFIIISIFSDLQINTHSLLKIYKTGACKGKKLTSSGIQPSPGLETAKSHPDAGPDSLLSEDRDVFFTTLPLCPLRKATETRVC